MRWSASRLETNSSPSFLRTTPAKNPRTECCCQPDTSTSAAMVAPAGCLRRSSSFVCLFARLFTAAAALTTPPARAGFEGSVERRFVGSLTGRGAVLAAFVVVRALPRSRRFDGGFRLRDDFSMSSSKMMRHQRRTIQGPVSHVALRGRSEGHLTPQQCSLRPRMPVLSERISMLMSNIQWEQALRQSNRAPKCIRRRIEPAERSITRRPF